MTDRLITEQFESFMKAGYNGPISESQYSDMKKAFFAGAVSLRNILFNNLSNEDECTDGDARLFVIVENEINEFISECVNEANKNGSTS